MSGRTAPTRIPQEGYHLEAAPSEYWVTPAVGAGRCRFTIGPNNETCRQPAVATRWRGYRDKRAWDYCADHLYGRWIENGEVLHWREVPDVPQEGQR